MPSLITQTIGSAVSSVTGGNTTAINTNTRQHSQPDQTSHQAIHQVLRAASEAATVAPNLKNRERIPQVPKRVEGTYKPRKGRAVAQAKDGTPEELTPTGGEDTPQTSRTHIDTEG